MPETTHRDPAETGATLAAWLEAHVEGATDVRVSNLEAPPTNGFSSETILFDASWDEAKAAATQHRLVARIAPTGYTVFLDPDFVGQCRVMRTVAEQTDVPMPSVLGIEEDATLLGAPFAVMQCIDGQIPTDTPPYASGGWLMDSPPEDQERLWWSGLEAMAKVHATDWKSLGLGFLDDSRRGSPGLDQQLSYYRDFYTWAAEGRQIPVATATLEWLESNRPSEDAPMALLWGDSRIGNMIFDDFSCVAVLDWEMTCLGQPEMDLGWWLYFDRQFTETINLERPAGFPSREDTIARYGKLLGREMENVEYYEVFAGFRFALVLARLGGLLKDSDILPIDSDFETNNLATQLLATMLDLPAPGA
jgi:aminoglycoside phosphotransferase (APT) family kinase protein